jgi:hypothetical protein
MIFLLRCKGPFMKNQPNFRLIFLLKVWRDVSQIFNCYNFRENDKKKFRTIIKNPKKIKNCLQIIFSIYIQILFSICFLNLRNCFTLL